MKNTNTYALDPSYSHLMAKKAGIDINLSSWGELGKALVLGVVAASAATGIAAGKVYQKATEPTDVDFSNAQRAYDVGALTASVRRQARRLQDEKNSRNVQPKSMRMI
jgi:hypothetical protein